MSDLIKVSVVIPTFQRSVELSRTLRFLNLQTEKSYEVIVVDDNYDEHETKKVIEICNRFDVSYLKNSRVKGGCGARNTGILAAKGELIAFLDDDDYWLPNKLEEQVSFMDRNPQYGASYSSYYAFFLNNKFYIENVAGDNLTTADLAKGVCPASTSLMIVRRAVITNIEMFDEKLPSFQDYDLWLKLSLVTKIGFVSKPLAIFTQHSGDRVSVNLTKRFNGLNLVQIKWNDVIEKFSDKNQFLSRFKSSAYASNANNVAGVKYWAYIKFRLLAFLHQPKCLSNLKLLILAPLGGRIFWKILKSRRALKISDASQFSRLLEEVIKS